MSSVEIVSKIDQLKEWEALAAEAAAEIENLKDSIKREMDMRGVEEIEAGQYIARFTTVLLFWIGVYIYIRYLIYKIDKQ